MFKLHAFAFLCFFLACSSGKAAITLTAIPDVKASVVSLQWNMVNYPSPTAYILLKSNDGIVWKIAAANPVYRNYKASTILAYSDRVAGSRKLYYRVRVYDINDNTVAISNTAIAEIPKAVFRNLTTKGVSPQANLSGFGNNASWQIFPNPVQDILNLNYKRTERIMGVINVLITDATGKIIIRFRQASNNKQLRIPVSNLKTGLYFIRVDVLNERQLNDKFIK